jgi:hypothetical protein
MQTKAASGRCEGVMQTKAASGRCEGVIVSNTLGGMIALDPYVE